MKTSEFITLLEENPSLGLQFVLENDYIVKSTFHITEIMNVTIESVDCGGNPDSYKQTIFQLMVNPNELIREPWTAEKALSIVNKVDKIKPIDGNTEIFFEYGDETLRTSHYSIANVEFVDGIIKVDLFAKPTVCKPSLGQAVQCCN
jgi:hypothetical protein